MCQIPPIPPMAISWPAFVPSTLAFIFMATTLQGIAVDGLMRLFFSIIQENFGFVITKFTMKLSWIPVLMIFCHGYFSNGVNTNTSARPKVVNVGSMFSFASTIGKVAKIAVQAAIEDVNADATILGTTKLNFTMLDSKFSGFLGIIQVLEFMEAETLAIIGPQSSITAHVINHLANELQVPFLSFSATDPTLTSLQYPFFVMTTQNDLFQMAAIAEIINYYEWRQVIAIYVDDDHGRNGITELSNQLSARRCSISYKAPLVPGANITENIRDVLTKVILMESRIIVVHAYAEWGIKIFDVAKYLGMMNDGYVWIATHWLSTAFDTDPSVLLATSSLEGVITLRAYTPDSEKKRNFVTRWRSLSRKENASAPVGLSTYGLYAYDSVWLLAHAIDEFFNRGGNISFRKDPKLNELHGGRFYLESLSIFNGGDLLRDIILQINMTGLTGCIQFTSDKNLVNPAFEVINLIGTGFRKIGYWSNYSGLSTVPPETLYSKPPNRSSSSQQLFSAIWPGQATQKPRGWVFPNNGRLLKIGVLNRVSWHEFVGRVPGSDSFKGFCIDVFTAAVALLPYAVPYKLIPFGNGHDNPSATELVRMITAGVYDAAIGDIAIITNRTRIVDFSQPYIESGLVVVAPVRKLNSDVWAFMSPFTPKMWCVTGIFFIFVGAVVWILEHRTNDDFRGPPRRQLITILWFSFSTWFFAHKENTISSLGRFVLIIWLFVVLIINSSYTASLTSILTVQQLSSPIKGIDSLINSHDRIGYPEGSFAFNYLTEELGIHESRLVPLNLPEDYVRALQAGPMHGGVAAIVDERAYADLFLSTRCEFSIVGQEFTKNGWGFAFQRDSPLAVDISTAILKLSENGDLQRIHDKWLLSSACTSEDAKLDAEQLQLRSFSGLFLICGVACLLSLLVYFIKTMCQFKKHYSERSELPSQSSRSGRLQTFLSFMDEKEASETRSRQMQHENDSNTSG